MQIKDIMTPDPQSVTSNTRLGVVKDIYDKEQFRHLLVVDDGHLVGVLSDRDLYKVISPYADTEKESKRDKMTLDFRVNKIMSRKVVSIHPTAPVMKAVNLFNQNRISSLPVVDENSKPVGIVSWRDVMKFLEEKVMQNMKAKVNEV